MPQFDKITFFNQIFWLIFLFSFFYFVLLKKFLPKLSAVLKLRAKKFLKGGVFNEFFNSETISTYNKSIKFLISFLNSFRHSLLKNFENYDFWIITTHKILVGKKKIQSLYLDYFSCALPKKFKFT